MRHWAIVIALLLMTVVVQAVVIGRSVVPSLDAGRFLVNAEWMDRQGVLAIARILPEQPLFSVWVCTVRGLLRFVWGDFPSLGAVSVQVAAAVPMVLLVVPVYFVSLRMYGARAAIGATALFSILPETARLGADGISDGTHLFLFALALWPVLAFLTGPGGRGAMADEADCKLKIGEGNATAQFAVTNLQLPICDSSARQAEQPRVGSPWLLLAAGLATGIAVLARAEVLVLPAAMVILVLGASLRSAWRRRLALGAAAYAAGVAVVLVPYLLLVGSISPREAMSRLLGRPGPQLVAAVPHGQGDQAPLASGSPAPWQQLKTSERGVTAAWKLPGGQAMCFAVKEAGTSRHRGLGRSLRALGTGLCEAFWYWVGLLGIYGLWTVRGVRAGPADWFLRLFFLLYCVGAAAFASREGYLCARHLQPLVVVGIGCCGFGAIELGQRLSRLYGAWRRAKGIGWDGPAAALVVLLAWGACLGQTLVPVGRAGAAHRSVGDWLAAEQTPGTVVDTKGWSRLYSGRATFQYADGPAGFADPELAYVVVEPWELTGQTARSRTLAQLLSSAGQRVAGFSAGRQGSQDVAVYRWRPERLGKRDPIVTDAVRVHDARTSASLCSQRGRGL